MYPELFVDISHLVVIVFGTISLLPTLISCLRNHLKMSRIELWQNLLKWNYDMQDRGLIPPQINFFFQMDEENNTLHIRVLYDGREILSTETKLSSMFKIRKVRKNIMGTDINELVKKLNNLYMEKLFGELN